MSCGKPRRRTSSLPTAWCCHREIERPEDRDPSARFAMDSGRQPRSPGLLPIRPAASRGFRYLELTASGGKSRLSPRACTLLDEPLAKAKGTPPPTCPGGCYG